MPNARIPLLNNTFTFTSGGLLCMCMVNLSEESHRFMDTTCCFTVMDQECCYCCHRLKGRSDLSSLAPSPNSLSPSLSHPLPIRSVIAKLGTCNGVKNTYCVNGQFFKVQIFHILSINMR